MIVLLDVNVLIALVDTTHVHHAAAKRYYLSIQTSGWATCPITENGFLRILGRPNVGHSPDSPVSARILFQGLLSSPGHQFWPDDISLSDLLIFPLLPSSQNLTDIYLLALAVKHSGRFATFDSKIDSSIIPGGKTAYFKIPTP